MTAIAASTLRRGLAAYLASEAAAKASRLAVVLIAARTLEPAAIGLAAAAMASGEILKALGETGAVQRVVAAPEAALPGIAATAHRAMWVWCAGLTLAHLAIAGATWAASGDAVLALMIAVLAAEYLFMPGGIVQAALALREGRLAGTAAVAGAQVMAQNALTVALLVVWPDPWALVVPKVLSAPVWLVGMRWLRPWRPEPGARAALGPFVRFGAPILGVELVKALRLNADKLLVGAALGPEALGVWFFAVNAGLGLANALAQAFSLVLFPHLCRAEDRQAALGAAMRLALVALAPLVVLQALLAPVYVPLVFGADWAGVSDLVSVLCLMALPGLVWSGAAQALRAEARTGREFAVTATLAVLLALVTLAAAPHGLMAIAWAQVVVAAVVQITAARPALAAAFLNPAPTLKA